MGLQPQKKFLVLKNPDTLLDIIKRLKEWISLQFGSGIGWQKLITISCSLFDININHILIFFKNV